MFEAEVNGVAVMREGIDRVWNYFGLDAVSGRVLWYGPLSEGTLRAALLSTRHGLLWFLTSSQLVVLGPKTGDVLGLEELGFSAVTEFASVDVEPGLFWEHGVLIVGKCKNAEGGPGHRFHYYKIIGEREVASGEGTDGE